jgi:hypothetical protein
VAGFSARTHGVAHGSPAAAVWFAVALGLGWPTAARSQHTATITLTDSLYEPVLVAYPPSTRQASVRVVDFDLGSPTSIDSLVVAFQSPLEASEPVVLIAAPGSSAFDGHIDLDIRPAGDETSVPDGRLQIQRGQLLRVAYQDAQDDFGSPRNVEAVAVFGAVQGAVHGTWTSADSPYFVVEDASVMASDVLSIEPGVEVRFMPGAFLRIHGSLQVSGSEPEPVRFISDECGNPNRNWPTLDIRTAGTSTTHSLRHVVFDCGYGVWCYGNVVMEHVTVRNQGRAGIIAHGSLQASDCRFEGNTNAVFAEGLQMSECIVQGNADAGVTVKSGTVQHTTFTGNGRALLCDEGSVVRNCTIVDNDHGVTVLALVRPGSAFEFRSNELHDNGATDFRNESAGEVDVGFNYWGPITTAEMDAGGNPKNIARIYDVYDDPRFGFANYARWLAAPPQDPVSPRTWSQVKSTYR